MVHSTIKDLAKGFIKTAKKEVKQAVDLLVDKGAQAAQDFVCTAIESKTGLPHDVCNRAAEFVVKDLSKVIRKKLQR